MIEVADLYATAAVIHFPRTRSSDQLFMSSQMTTTSSCGLPLLDWVGDIRQAEVFTGMGGRKLSATVCDSGSPRLAHRPHTTATGQDAM